MKGFGEMTPQLRALVALLKELSSIPRIHIKQLTTAYKSSFRGDPMPSFGFHGYLHARSRHKYTFPYNVYLSPYQQLRIPALHLLFNKDLDIAPHNLNISNYYKNISKYL